MIFFYFFLCQKVYKGLDIITNKMPMDEREGIKHHLMDFLEPEEEYKVTSFLKDASQKVRSIMKMIEMVHAHVMSTLD